MLLYIPRLYRAIMSERIAEFGLFANQPPILHFISKKGSLTQKELADEFLVAPPTMTDTIQRLEKAGYIKRQPDKNDARVMRVCLTPKGDEIRQKTSSHFQSVAAGLLDDFSPEEKERLLLLLCRITENLERMRQNDKTT